MTDGLVLYYHHVTEDPGDHTYVTPTELRRQLTWLSERSVPRTLEEIVGGAAGFGVSFDDGYDDVLSALDLLDRLAIHATFFILPAFAGVTSQFNRLSRSVRHAGRDDLRRVRSAGHDIGSHGMTHRDMTTLSAADVEWELRESRRLLEELVEEHVSSFAYPFGACDARTADACSRWYRTAWSTGQTKAARASSARHAVPRAYLLAGENGDYNVVR